MERYWRLGLPGHGFVQISLDGGRTWTSAVVWSSQSNGSAPIRMNPTYPASDPPCPCSSSEAAYVMRRHVSNTVKEPARSTYEATAGSGPIEIPFRLVMRLIGDHREDLQARAGEPAHERGRLSRLERYPRDVRLSQSLAATKPQGMSPNRSRGAAGLGTRGPSRSPDTAPTREFWDSRTSSAFCLKAASGAPPDRQRPEIQEGASDGERIAMLQRDPTAGGRRQTR